MIVADESRSISYTFMIRLKEFVLDLARQFPVSDTQTHVGVMRFSTPERTQVDIKVNQITNKTELITAIDNIPFEGDGRGAATYHMLAMMTALEELQKNGRKNVDDVIILVTDGFPQPDTQSARSIAAEARKNGTTIYGVYVGSGEMAEEGRAEIRNISDRAFEVDDFNALGSIVNDVTSEECQSELLLSSNCMSLSYCPCNQSINLVIIIENLSLLFPSLFPLSSLQLPLSDSQSLMLESMRVRVRLRFAYKRTGNQGKMYDYYFILSRETLHQFYLTTLEVKIS